MSLQVHIEKQMGSFHLRADFETDGGILGLLGASGCGKSMTLKCIAGIETPDSGRIVLDGVTLFDSEKHINLKPQQRHVGYLFQSYALFPQMTVRQNILCGLHDIRDKAEKEKQLLQACELLQIGDLLKHKPHQLSGGQQQRVALARILVNRPRLLMLDEPFSALDSHLREKLQIEMKVLLNAYGRDVLMVTHSRDEAYHLCSRIAVMDNGRMLTIKPTKALFANPESRFAAMLTGCKNIADCHRTGEYEVEVPAWGIRLQTALPVREDVCAIGIRAHYFNTKTTLNAAPVVKTGEMEEPFETIIRFRYESQSADSPDIWWRIPKDRVPQSFPKTLGIAPVNILPLYE